MLSPTAAVLAGAVATIATALVSLHGDRFFGKEIEIFEGAPPVSGWPLWMTSGLVGAAVSAVALSATSTGLLVPQAAALILLGWAVLCDLRSMQIPNILSLGGSLIPIGLSLIGGVAAFQEVLYGSLLGLGGMLLFWLASFLLSGGNANALGLGDVKSALLIGAAVGRSGILGYFLAGMPVATILTYLVILIVWPERRKQPVPFLPTLGLAAALWLVWLVIRPF